MIKYLLILVFIFSAAKAASPDLAELDSLGELGVALVQREQFDSALVLLNKIIDDYPDHPAGYFFTAAAYQTILDDYRADRLKDEFNRYIELAIEKGKAKLKTEPTAINYFYTGAAMGYRGIFRAFHGNWWGAFWDGGKAKAMMEEVLKLDSTFYDAYYGLGTYYYWRSAKSKSLWWLPFFGDNRQKGIEFTKLAIQKGKFAKVEGKYALLRIYAEEGDWDQVKAWYDSVISVNPEDPYSLWLLAQAYYNQKDFEGARQIYQRELMVQRASPYFETASEMEVRYQLSLIDYEEGNYKSALSQLGYVFAHRDEAEKNHYAQNVLEWAKELKEKIDQKLGTK